jgi:hypothetical protein
MRLPIRLIGAVAFCAAAPLVLAQTPPPPPPPPPPPVAVPETLAPRTQTVTRIEETTTTNVTTESAPQPLGFESDIYCFGYLASRPESFSGRVMGAENIAEQIDFIDHDVLYIDGGHDRGFKPGDEFWLITPEQEIPDPVTGRTLGRFYQYRGRGRIEFVQPRSSILRVTNSCTDIPLGSYLKPFEPIPIPLGRKTPLLTTGDPPSGRATGHVIFTPEGLESLGADHTVLVNVGVAEGAEPGDFLTVYRYARGRPVGREIGEVGANWVKVKERQTDDVEVPRTYLGEISILMVGDHWAIGRIAESFRLIEIGDEVELK